MIGANKFEVRLISFKKKINQRSFIEEISQMKGEKIYLDLFGSIWMNDELLLRVEFLFLYN